MMCLIMSIVTAKTDYIIKANSVYLNLEEYEKVFRLEALIINHIKCLLVRNETLDDFMIDGVYVSVYGHNDEYDLYFHDYVISITVYEKQIVDFVIKRN